MSKALVYALQKKISKAQATMMRLGGAFGLGAVVGAVGYRLLQRVQLESLLLWVLGKFGKGRRYWLKKLENDAAHLQHAPSWVKRDFELVLRAVEANIAALRFSDPSLRNHDDLLKVTKRRPRLPLGYYRFILSKKYGLGVGSGCFSSRVLDFLTSDKRLRDFAFYDPDCTSKGFCGPNRDLLTNAEFPCRGTDATCKKSMRTSDGFTTAATCWRYDYRWHAEDVQRGGGFMLQIIELAKGKDDTFHPQLGPGQIIEADIAKELGMTIVTVQQTSPIEETSTSGLAFATKEKLVRDMIDAFEARFDDSWVRNAERVKDQSEIRNSLVNYSSDSSNHFEGQFGPVWTASKVKSTSFFDDHTVEKVIVKQVNLWNVKHRIVYGNRPGVFEEQSLDNVRQEIQVLQAVGRKQHHDNIIKLHEVVSIPNKCICIVLEWGGQTWLTHLNILAKLGTTWKRHASASLVRFRFVLLSQLMEAVRFLHETVRYCHFDISLENLVIDDSSLKRGSPKLRLIDFGLARRLDLQNCGSTRKLQAGRKGKTACMAPELYHCADVVDGISCDAWSVAMVIFEVMVGRKLCDVPDERADKAFAALQLGGLHAACELRDKEGFLYGHAFNIVFGMLQMHPNARMTMKQALAIAGHHWRIPLPADAELLRRKIIEEEIVPVSKSSWCFEEREAACSPQRADTKPEPLGVGFSIGFEGLDGSDNDNKNSSQRPTRMRHPWKSNAHDIKKKKRH